MSDEILRDEPVEHKSENDAYANITDGNLYLAPNIEATLMSIEFDNTLYNYDWFTLTDCTLKVRASLVGPGATPPYYYTYFRDGSYIKMSLSENWSTGTVPILQNIGFTSWFGIKDPETGIIEETGFLSLGGLPGYFEHRQINPTPTPEHPEAVIVQNIMYQPGDTFSLNIGWWYPADPKMRGVFICESAGNGAYNYEDEIGVSSMNILSSGGIIAVNNSTEAQHKIMDFLAGDQSEGVDYPGEPTDDEDSTGSFMNPDENVGWWADPSIHAIDFGFVSIYNPSTADLKQIADWLWDGNFETNVKKNFISPFENILALAIVPFDIPGTYTDIAELQIGNVPSGVQTNRIKDHHQYIDKDCGSRHIVKTYGGFLDYDCNYTIYLPYVGYKSLRPDDIVGRDVNVKYKIDLLTGTFVCAVFANWTDDNGSHTKALYIFNGNMFYQIPISGANFMSMYNQQLQASNAGLTNFMQSASNIISGVATTMMSGLTGNVAGVASGIGSTINGGLNMFTGQNEAKRMYETAKPEYGRGGNLNGSAGYISKGNPYIIKSMPLPKIPSSYNHHEGIPSMTTHLLSDLSGYTEVEAVTIDFDCRDDEKQEIMNLLKGGVYL